MADRQTALALVLDYVGVPLSIQTVSDRMALQKVVYLIQHAGISLGYTYGWYLKGPYSPSLTRDYYDLVSSGEADVGDFELKESVKTSLRKVKDLIGSRPANLSLPRWLELLASIAFLQKERRLSKEATQEKIEGTKGHLVPYLDAGFAALQ